MDMIFNENKLLDNEDLHMLSLYDPSALKNLFQNRYIFEALKQNNTKRVREVFKEMGRTAQGFIYMNSMDTPSKFKRKLYFEKEEDITWFLMNTL